jgi:hypothetical protein
MAEDVDVVLEGFDAVIGEALCKLVDLGYPLDTARAMLRATLLASIEEFEL